MSCAVCSFFRSHVLDVAASANGSFVHALSAASARWVDTSEKVTSSDFASVYGLSFSISVMVPVVPDGPVDGPPHAYDAAKAAATARAEMKRMKRFLLSAILAMAGPDPVVAIRRFKSRSCENPGAHAVPLVPTKTV